MTFNFNADNFGKTEGGNYDYNNYGQFQPEPYTGLSPEPTAFYPGDTPTIDQSSSSTGPPTPNFQAPALTYTSPTWTSSPWDCSLDQRDERDSDGYVDDGLSYQDPGASYYNPGIQYPREDVNNIQYTSNYGQGPSSNDARSAGWEANTAQPTPGFIENQVTAVPVTEEAIVALPETPTAEGAFRCKHCDRLHNDAKSRDRHEMEVHDKPKRGENQLGWYRCKCGKEFCVFRKFNYTRHRNTCTDDKKTMLTYHCQCGSEDVDEEEHVAHYKKCSEGRRPAGRPPRSPHSPRSGVAADMENLDYY